MAAFIRPTYILADEVVLLDRKRFKTFVGELARELAVKQVDSAKDYIGVMSSVGRLAKDI